jgi:hypothetical protein
MLAMQRAVQGLSTLPQLALVDGNQAPKLGCTVQTVIKGDALVPAISAASILAKTARDADLLRLHALYPQYAFDQHKGYGTPLHLEMLREHGPCAEHRRSFAPIKAFGLTSCSTSVLATIPQSRRWPSWPARRASAARRCCWMASTCARPGCSITARRIRPSSMWSACPSPT